jgi:hypothetical protein
MQPTFVPFSPWTTRESYFDLLQVIAENDLVSSVPSIQLAIRLLIPSRSRLLELPEIAALVGEFDPEKLVYPWRHADREMDALAENISRIVMRAEKGESRTETFSRIWDAAQLAGGTPIAGRFQNAPLPQRMAPYLSEPWYC